MDDEIDSIEAEYIELLEEEVRFQLENKLNTYKPYAKQLAFHNNPARERLFMAGNQLGKTLAGSYETAIHLTGLYPDWWKGRRFNKPVKFWVAGLSGESTRDNPQRLLMGEIGEWGTGAIPKSLIERPALARGISDLIDHVPIRHASGGLSHLYFKFYGKGRAKWQGETLDGIWFDEEPDIEVYQEGLTRTNAKMGIVMVTFTPLLGLSDVVMRFHKPEAADIGAADRSVIQMTIDEAPHYTPDQRRRIVASMSEHEREARAKGIPFLGSGKVFPIPEEDIKVSPFPIPDWWPRIVGLDFGWGSHPTAAVMLAHDRDTDTVYLTDVYKSKEAGIAYHVLALKKNGDVPIAWPHDGIQRDKSSAVQIRKLYQDQGLNMVHTHAQYPDNRKNGLEASVMDLYERFKSGRLKIFTVCEPWFEEYRLYHRKDGIIQPVRDDLLSATRYAIMMLRFAAVPKERPLSGSNAYKRKRRKSTSWMSH